MNIAASTPRLQTADGRCTVTLCGVLDNATLDVLETMQIPPHVTELLIDLLDVGSFTPQARKRLVPLQETWSQGGRRTAWLADRAALRGMALWVMHQAHDEFGKAVGSRIQADRWLAGVGTRVSVSLARLNASTGRST